MSFRQCFRAISPIFEGRALHALTRVTFWHQTDFLVSPFRTINSSSAEIGAKPSIRSLHWMTSWMEAPVLQTVSLTFDLAMASCHWHGQVIDIWKYRHGNEEPLPAIGTIRKRHAFNFPSSWMDSHPETVQRETEAQMI
jgi:hypothetical protein